MLCTDGRRFQEISHDCSDPPKRHLWQTRLKTPSQKGNLWPLRPWPGHVCPVTLPTQPDRAGQDLQALEPFLFSKFQIDSLLSLSACAANQWDKISFICWRQRNRWRVWELSSRTVILPVSVHVRPTQWLRHFCHLHLTLVAEKARKWNGGDGGGSLTSSLLTKEDTAKPAGMNFSHSCSLWQMNCNFLAWLADLVEYI